MTDDEMLDLINVLLKSEIELVKLIKEVKNGLTVPVALDAVEVY